MWVCRLPVYTSARWEVANSPQISVKPVHSAGPMWASAPTVKLAAAFEFADSFCFTRLPAARPLRRAAFLFSLYNRGGVCYNIKDYDRVKGDTHEIFDRSDL